MTEIVAEISGNHGGSIHNALRLIRIAKSCGADAVKFQCFEPEQLADKRSKNPEAVILSREFHHSTLLELYEQIHTPKEWFSDLIGHCLAIDISWFSSVFHPDDVKFLETLNCPRYKISAFEMLDGDLINAVVATGKPIVMSIRPMEGVTILRATSYPKNGLVGQSLGLSDHSKTGLADMLPGYPMVERHIRLPDVPCHDEKFSSTPAEFKIYVDQIRSIKL